MRSHKNSIRHRKQKRYKSKLWKRCLAAVSMMAILIGCVYYPGLESVLAEEKSGYRIDTAYQSETNQVILTGNTEEVKAGVTLGVVKDQEGQEYAADSFQTTVGENGEYTYELTYSSVNAQTGAVEEKTEELKVTVNQIQAPAAKAVAQADQQETEEEAAPAEEPPAEETQTPAEETGAEESADAADTIPVSELQTAYQAMSAQERATAAGSMNVNQYAEEKNLTKIGSVEFSGGSLEEGQGPEWTPGDGTGVTRAFASAGYVLDGEDGSTPHLITGLFPWKNEQGTYDWYYTADGQEGSGQDYGTIMVGHRLPDTATVRFYYRLSSPKYTLTIAENFNNLGFDYMVEGAAGGTYSAGATGSYEIMAGDTITFSVKLPGTYLGARVTLSGLNGNPVYGLQRQASDNIGSYTQLATLADPTNYWYEIEFIMPAAAVTASLQETGWSGGSSRSFAVYLPDSESNPNASQNYEFGFTRLFTTHITTPGGGINWSKQIGYDPGRSIPNNPYGARLGMGYYKTDTAGYRKNDSGNVTTQDSASDKATPGSPSKSTVSGVGGGAPYTHSEWYGWREGSTSYQNGETVKQSSDNTQTGNYSLNLTSAYADPWSTSTTPMAKGQYYPGQTVGFRLEMAKGGTTGTSGNTLKYYYRPGNIMLDVYSGDGSITDKDFERYTISLSDLKGVLSGGENDSSGLPTSKSISVAGGTITIKCISYGTTTFDPQNPTGKASEANQYGGQWNGGFGNQSYYNKYGHNDDKNYPNRLASAPIFAYYIEVDGLTRPFKISYRLASGAQQNNVIQTMNGVEEGAYASSDVTGSTISVKSGSSTVTRPLVEGFLWNNNEKINSSYNDIAVALNEGYGQLKIQYVDEGGGPLSTGNAAFRHIDSQGRYVYRLTNSRESNTISQIHITAQPLTFTTEYIYNDQDYTGDAGGAVTLSYDSSNGHVRSLKIPASAIPKNATGFLQGFTVKVLGPAGSAWISELQNPDGGSTWDIGDEIQVEYVYEKLKTTNAIKDGINDFRIQLIANMAEGDAGEFVSANYTIYNQHTYFDGAAYVDADDYDESLLDNFYDRTDSIRVQKNVEIMLVGFKESYVGSEDATMTGKKYILDETRSATHATVAVDGEHIGNVYYAVATEIKIKIPTDLSGVETVTKPINDWNARYGTRYYSGNSMVDPFTQLLPGMPDTVDVNGKQRDFAGWKIVQGTYNSQTGTTEEYENWIHAGYTIQQTASGAATLNLNAMGRDTNANGGLVAWKDAFTGVGSGTLTLVPYYLDSTKPITLKPDGSTTTGDVGTQTVYVNSDGTHNHTLTSTFYMEGNALTPDAKARYAIYAYGVTATGTHVWGRVEHGVFNLSTGNITNRYHQTGNVDYYFGYTKTGSAEITVDTASTPGYSTYTLTISGIKEHPGGTGRQYRVYMWNDGNGMGEDFDPLNSYDETSEQAVTDVINGVFGHSSGGTTGGAARHSYELKMIYPFTPVQVSDPNADGAYNNAYTAGQNSVTIQTGGDDDGTATLEAKYYYTGASWNDYAGEKMSIALYRDGKKATGGDAVTDQFALSTVNLPSLTANGEATVTLDTASRNMQSTAVIRLNNDPAQSGGSFTIKFKILNGSESDNRLQYLYEDATSPSQRVWRLYAWNLANANGNLSNIDATAATSGTDPLPTEKNSAKVAQVENKLHIVPKAVASTSSVMHVEEVNPTRAKTGTNFLVTATFQLDQNYPFDLQLGKENAGGDSNDQTDAKMHTTLMKLNPGDTDADWKTWMFDGTRTNQGVTSSNEAKVEVVSVTENSTDSQVTITYRLIDVNGSITREWENGAKYEILAWNYTNAPGLKGKAISADTLNAQFSHSGGASYDGVPSVIHTVSMVAPEMESMSVTQDTFDVHTGGDSSGTGTAGVDIEAKFRYENVRGFTWETMRDTLKFALYRHVARGNDAGDTKWAEIRYDNGNWVLERVYGQTSDKLSTSVTVSDPTVESGYQVVTVKMRIQNKVQSGGPSIRYAWEDSDANMGTEYRVYAWSEGNEYQKTGAPATGNAANDLVYKAITTEAGVEPETDAKFSAKLNVLPAQVKSNQVSGGSGTETGYDDIYHWSMPEDSADADGNIPLSVTFETDQYWYPNTVRVAETDKTDETKLRAALFIRFAGRTNADGSGTDWGEWTLIADQDGVKEMNSLDDSLVITQTDAATTTEVSWELDANYVKGQTFQYCVALWNDTNTGTSVSADEFTPENPSTQETYNKIPSVTQEIRPEWQNPSYYVYVPKTIILTEDGASENLQSSSDGTYVGNSGTIRYVTEDEWVSPDPLDPSYPTAFPDIIICTARQFHIQNSDHSKTITVGVYQADGTALADDVHNKDDYGTIGTLKKDTTENLTYQLNAKLPDGIKKDEVFSGIMTYHFNSENHDTTEAGGTGQ